MAHGKVAPLATRRIHADNEAARRALRHLPRRPVPARRVGFAAVKLLEDAGCRVEVPRAQTCCGQPAFNSGDRATTEAWPRG